MFFIYTENNKCQEKHNFCLVLPQDLNTTIEATLKQEKKGTQTVLNSIK